MAARGGAAQGKPTFFATPGEFGRWLDRHHASEKELLVGFYKKKTGKANMTWPESVDEALCFGWIDGVRRSLGEESYTIRFTPRKERSNWSAVNVRRVAELTKEGRMRPAGMKAFEQRAAEKTGIYAYENKHLAELDGAQRRRFRANKKAWDYFRTRPEWYRKTATWWVISAKREETRERRLEELIETSEKGETIRPLTRPAARGRETGVAKGGANGGRKKSG